VELRVNSLGLARGFHVKPSTGQRPRASPSATGPMPVRSGRAPSRGAEATDSRVLTGSNGSSLWSRPALRRGQEVDLVRNDWTDSVSGRIQEHRPQQLTRMFSFV
jgi:hypothetical protein